MTEPTSNPAQTPMPPPVYPPAQPTAYPPAYPTGVQPAYPGVYPGQPTAYPVSAAPASAFPVSAYPTAYAAPPRPGTSPWIWVLAAISAILLLSAAGLGVAYLGAQNRISELEQTVADVEDELDEVRVDLENTEEDFDEAQACVDAFGAWWDAPIEDDDAEWAEMIGACQ